MTEQLELVLRKYDLELTPDEQVTIWHEVAFYHETHQEYFDQDSFFVACFFNDLIKSLKFSMCAKTLVNVITSITLIVTSTELDSLSGLSSVTSIVKLYCFEPESAS